MRPRLRHTSGPVVLALGMLGCGGGEAGPTEPSASPSVACSRPAPAAAGIPELLPPEADCVSIDLAQANYALAWFDTRYVEASRTMPETVVPGLPDPTVTVRATRDPGTIRTLRVRAPRERVEPGDWIRLSSIAEEGDPDDLEDADDPDDPEAGPAARAPSDACHPAPGYRVFCREAPWREGDTLTIPAPFGRFVEGVPRPAEILLVRGPFAFAVSRDLDEAARHRLEPLLVELALVGRVRVLPFLRRAFVDRPVRTSSGSRQILVDIVFDEEPVCLCGVAVGHLVDGEPVAGISMRITDGPEFQAHRIGLFAHELSHVWQHAYDAGRVADPAVNVAPTTHWGREGGADFVRQEILRGLAAEPLDPNRDATLLSEDPFLDRWIRDLGSATGHIRDGYRQTAGLLRHFFVRAVEGSESYDAALRAVLLGASDGWFAPTDPGVGGEGLEARLRAAWPSFDPVRGVLEYALANAVDDRTSNEGLQNTAILEAWRPSPGSRFTPAATIFPRDAASISSPAGSVGYVWFAHSGPPVSLRFEADVEGVRWMIIRFR